MSQVATSVHETAPDGPTAVLCGSFHRNQTQLKATFESLRRSFVLLSPLGVDWIDPEGSFVRLAQETTLSASDIEDRHLSAIRNADLVWLFCPDGYVGSSAAMEIGYAHAAGIPVLSDRLPDDPVLRSMVTHVPGGINDAANHLALDPGRPLAALQNYYERIARRRGWSDESPRDTLLLMAEEFGELARAVRHELSLARDGRAYEGSAAEELADVQLYLVHLATALKIDLARAVTAKEAVNAERAAKTGRAA